MTRPVRIAFAGGGTGGHFYPALAIAREFERQTSGALECLFFGTTRGIECREREQIGWPLVLLPVRGLARRLTLDNLLVPLWYLISLWKSLRALRSFRPDMVVGTGGYVALPVLKAASWLSIPTALQEQNSYPGITTRAAARTASRIFLGFAEASSYLPSGVKTLLSGNPIRSQIGTIEQASAKAALGLDQRRKTILILGGSQGARAVNQAIIRGLASHFDASQYQLLWQTGTRDYTEVVAAAGEAARIHSLFPFDSRMELMYGAADLAIARAGAITLAELAASKLPSILIPYPHAAGDHQRHNARAVASAGAAIICDESELATRNLLLEAAELLSSGKGESMRNASASLAPTQAAAQTIVTELLSIIHTRENRQA